jgi:hypothetical protein
MSACGLLLAKHGMYRSTDDMLTLAVNMWLCEWFTESMPCSAQVATANNPQGDKPVTSHTQDMVQQWLQMLQSTQVL